MTRAPEFHGRAGTEKGRRPAPPFCRCTRKRLCASGRLLIDHPRGAVAAGDLDLARLHRLGDLTHEIDMEQTIGEARAGDLDMVGELEMALEGASRDAAMQIFRGVLVLPGLAANQELVLLDRDVEILVREAGPRHAQAISVLAGRFDGVWRVGAGAL